MPWNCLSRYNFELLHEKYLFFSIGWIQPILQLFKVLEAKKILGSPSLNYSMQARLCLAGVASAYRLKLMYLTVKLKNYHLKQLPGC
jgi:hypothetical protein